MGNKPTKPVPMVIEHTTHNESKYKQPDVWKNRKKSKN